MREITAKVGTHSLEVVKLDERYRYDVVGNIIRVKRKGHQWDMFRIWKINRTEQILFLEA